MDDPLTVSLLVTAIGMAVVFLAMALIYGAMQLLTAVARDRRNEQAEPTSPPPVETSEGSWASDDDRLRAAAVAIALARARGVAIQQVPSGETTPWGEFYRRRHLGARGRGRTG
jgi:Na+-transporting methylmalonyl-CoA/oxaloacetate decarboxylase gamma subunit